MTAIGTEEETMQFIKDLMYNVEYRLRSDVKKMPDTWSGKEIRQYMADKFNAEIACTKMNRAERNQYEKDLANSML